MTQCLKCIWDVNKKHVERFRLKVIGSNRSKHAKHNPKYYSKNKFPLQFKKLVKENLIINHFSFTNFLKSGTYFLSVPKLSTYKDIT